MPAEAVDAIIAQMEVRLGNYVTNFNLAADAHERYTRTRPDKAGTFSTADVERYANRHKQVANDVATAEEQTTAKVARSRKARTDSVKASEASEVANAKASANARVETEEQAQARISAAVDRGLAARASSVRAAGQRERSVPGSRASAAASSAVMRGTVVPGAAPVAAAPEAEINHLLADRVDLQQRLRYATRDEKVELQDQLSYLQRIDGYRRAGLSEVDAINRAEAVGADLERSRLATTAERQVLLEKQMRSKSGDISTGIVGAGSLLVGGIGVAELSHLNDEYIKLQNTLRVAGVATSELDQVQAHLLSTANRSGTDIGALADVYRGAALASKDLGASQGDLLKITDAAANALRIQGRSSGEARGALLQLSHAFESGRVTSREFNSLSLNLYPILQAVAKGSDQFGGSVAKLRQALIDGDISSKVFFQDLLRGSDDLAARASKATLTTAQGFTALNNQLVVYFGEANKAQGVSATLGGALQFLADHLDELIPALAAVGTALAVGYVTRMAAAAIATRGLGGAILGAFGGPVGLAISAATIAVSAFVVESNNAAAQVAKTNEQYQELQDRLHGASVAAGLAASGSAQVGHDALGAIPKVNAFAGAVGNLADQLYRQARAARVAQVESLKSQLTAGRQQEQTYASRTPAGRADIADANRAAVRRGDILAVDPSVAVSRLSSFFSNGRTDRENQAAYQRQVAINRATEQQIAQLSRAPITAADVPGGPPNSGGLNARAQKSLNTAQTKLLGLRKLAEGATGKRLDRINGQIKKTEAIVSDLQQGVSVGAATAAEGGGAGRTRRGPSAETLAHRAEAARIRGVHDDEAYTTALKTARDQELKAQADLSNDAAKRADLERDRLIDDATANAKNIIAKGPKDPRQNGGVAGTGERSAMETSTLLGLNVATLDYQLQGVDRTERQRNAADAANLDRAELEIRRNQLQGQQDLATTTAERKRLADQLLDLDYQLKAKELRATLAPDSGASDTDRTIAQKRLDALPGEKQADQRKSDRQFQGPGAAYRDSLDVDRGDFIQGEEVKALSEFNSGLDSSIAKALHLHGIFGSIVNDLIDMAAKQLLLKPLASALFGAGDGASASGAGGLLGSLLGSIGIGSKGGASGGAFFGGLSGGSGIGDLSGGGLPGFADGGSAIIGGNPGRDQNLLSINGKPSLRVGKGETLTITPPNVAAANQRLSAPQVSTVLRQTVNVDASGSVNPDGYAEAIVGHVRRETRAIVAQSQGATLQAVPGVIKRQQTLGG